MKRILLDENMPVSCRHWFPDDHAETVEYRRWKSLQNGALLEAAVRERFDVFLTADKAIKGAQHLPRFPSLAFVIVPTNAWPILQQMRSTIEAAVARASPGAYQELRWREP